MTIPSLVPRLVFPRVIEALNDTRIVVIQGARQVGKSTLSRHVLDERPGVSVTLDDPESFDFAGTDPTGFVAQAPDRLLAIDELQRVPELVVALARFSSTRDRADYVDHACAGGYPEALARTSTRRRQDWYTAYLRQIIRRDAVDISGLRRIADLPRLLRFIAARMGSTMVWSSLAVDAAMPRRTLDRYVALLETLFLTHTLPAWTANLTSREVKQPKVFPVDSGLAASLLGVESGALGPGSALSGALLECFVVGELKRQQGWAATRTTLYHYRDSRGVEVDAILETPDGRVVGVEVKASATVRAKDAAGLSILRDRLGDRFVAGYVLHTGRDSVAVGDRVTAVPMDALWAAT